MYNFNTPTKINDDKMNTPKSNLRNELKKVLLERNMLTAKSKSKVIQMLDEISPIRQDDGDKRLSLRRRAIEEVFTSEKAYQKQLDILMNFFVIPLKEQSIIDSATHLSLFGQLEIIYNLNKELLSELEDDLDNVANGFIRLAPFFKLYSVYAFDFKNSIFTIQNLMVKNSPFRKFLERTESRPEVQTKLQSLLIAPIQRVPRYRLLLQQVLLYTSPSDSDFKPLQDSVKQITATVSHIDSIIEDHENAQTLVNLQNSLTNKMPHIIKPSRKVIKEGVLSKISKNGPIVRYCVLFSDIFLYCKILKDRAAGTSVENSLECCCIFPLKKCKVAEMFPGNFKLSCQGDGIILCSDNVSTSKAWVKILNESIDLHIDYRKTLRKESSKRKPTRKREVKHFENDLSQLANKKYNHQKTLKRVSQTPIFGKTLKRKFEEMETPVSKKAKKDSTGNGWFWPFSKFHKTPKIEINVMDDEDENDPNFDPTYGFARLNAVKTEPPIQIDDYYQPKDALYPLRESFDSNKSVELKRIDSPHFETSTPTITGVLRTNKPSRPVKKSVTFNKHNNKPYEYSPQYQPPGKVEPYNFVPQHLACQVKPNLSLKHRITEFFVKLLS